jgi:hypothetical protein
MKDTYTKTLLLQCFRLHKKYVIQRKRLSENHKVVFRHASIPEDISENIIKFAIHRHTTSTWDCKGDLFSTQEGVQECKCFTSTGPLSFSPRAHWDVLYVLDATRWLEDKYIIYRIPLASTSPSWKKIQVNTRQTFHDQSTQGKRPRLTWKELQPQLRPHCKRYIYGSLKHILG